MIYLDSSAVVKLVRQEAETTAPRSWLAANAKPLVSSSLVRTEVARALHRNDPAALTILPAVIALIHQRPVTDGILNVAARFPDATLRSLDAIHLATAADLSSVLTWFVAYDKRLSETARSHGLPVVTPA